MALNLAENIQAARERKEANYYNNMLAYGMNASGTFSEEDGKLEYSGGSMPDKTEMWNQFLAMKNGRITQQDIANFEASWKQANMVKTSSAIKELGKLSNMGYSPKKISKVIEEDEGLYNNLLDMVSDLEEQGLAGNENAMFAAENLKSYFPKEDKGFFGGSPFWTSTLTSLGILGVANRKPIIDNVKKAAKKITKKTGRIKGAGPTLAYTAYEAAPRIGRMAFGDTGEQVAGTAADVGLLGLAARKLMGSGSMKAKGLGALMYAAPVAYNYLFPDEE